MREASLGRKYTEQIKQAMSESRRGENNPFFGKKHDDKSLALLRAAAIKRVKPLVPGIEIEITDIETKLIIVYEYIRKVAKAIGSNIKTILRREKSQIIKGVNTPYKKRYMIVIKRK
jgi:hypothetical protein